jgi:hypothetical protein
LSLFNPYQLNPFFFFSFDGETTDLNPAETALPGVVLSTSSASGSDTTYIPDKALVLTSVPVRLLVNSGEYTYRS